MPRPLAFGITGIFKPGEPPECIVYADVSIFHPVATAVASGHDVHIAVTVDVSEFNSRHGIRTETPDRVRVPGIVHSGGLFDPGQTYSAYLAYHVQTPVTAEIKIANTKALHGGTVDSDGMFLKLQVCRIDVFKKYNTTFAGTAHQHIEIAMRDAVLNYCRTPMSKQVPFDSANRRVGNEIVGSSPGGLYPCKPGGPDDHCYIFASRANEEHWRRLARIIEREDLIKDPKLQNPNDRYEARDIVDGAITDWTMQHTKEKVMQAVAGVGVPCGAVFNTLELMHDQDFHARGIMTKIDHPQRGEVNVAGWPVKMSDSHVPIKSSPLLGADNEAIYGDWLGYSADDVRDMRERRVI